MRKLWLLSLLGLAITAGAAPLFDDLDNWQIPDEPEPVKAAPVSKKVTPAPEVDKGPEIVIQMADEGTTYGTARARSDSNEIAVMHRSAASLEKNLAGKSRFYVLFNANTPASSDQIKTAADGTQYAVVLFGKEGQNYRIFVFKKRGDQPLLAVAEDTRGKIKIYQKYGLNLGLTKNDFAQIYDKVKPTTITDKDTGLSYQAYAFEKNFFALFQNQQPVKHFSDEDAFIAYTNELQGIVLAEPEQETDEQSSKEEEVQEEKPPQKRSFKALVAQGTFYDRLANVRNIERDPEEQGWPNPGRYRSAPRSTSSRARSNRNENDSDLRLRGPSRPRTQRNGSRRPSSRRRR